MVYQASSRFLLGSGFRKKGEERAVLVQAPRKSHSEYRFSYLRPSGLQLGANTSLIIPIVQARTLYTVKFRVVRSKILFLVAFNVTAACKAGGL